MSLHLLNLNFHSIEGLAQEFALLCRWEGHGSGGGRQGSDGLVKGRGYDCECRDSGNESCLAKLGFIISQQSLNTSVLLDLTLVNNLVRKSTAFLGIKKPTGTRTQKYRRFVQVLGSRFGKYGVCIGWPRQGESWT